MISLKSVSGLFDRTIIIGQERMPPNVMRSTVPTNIILDSALVKRELESIEHEDDIYSLEFSPEMTTDLKMICVDNSIAETLISRFQYIRVLRFWLVHFEIDAFKLLSNLSNLQILEFSNISYIRDSRVVKAAKDLKRLAQEPFEDFLSDQNILQLQLNFTKFIPAFSSNSLISLELSVTTDVTNLHVQLWKMAKNCPNLTSLSLKFRKKISNFSDVTRFLPQLRSLTLFRVGIKGTDLTSSLRNLRNLESLSIHYCSELKTFDPTAFCSLLQLKTLRVGPGWKEFGDSHLLYAASGGLVETLDLRRVTVTDDGLKCLSNLPCLRSLNIISTKITQDGLNFAISQLQGFESQEKPSEKMSEIFDENTVPMCRDTEKEKLFKDKFRKTPSQQVLLKSRHLFSLAEG